MKLYIKKILAFFLCLTIIFLFAGCSKKEKTETTKQAKSTTQVASKEINVIVIGKDKDKKEIVIKTSQKYLRGALDEANLIQGENSEYGLMVTTVDGYEADNTNQEWWCFIQNGKSCEKGVDQTEIKNGDKIEIRLMVGY